MKKLQSIIVLLLLIAGCGTQGALPTAEYISNAGYDFRQYSQQGFMFTTEGFDGDYESVGFVRIVYNPQFIKIPSGGDIRDFEDSRVYQDPVNPAIHWRVSEPDEGKMIEAAYQRSVDMGADAIIRFQIHNIRIRNNELVVNSSELTGLAIKRVE